MCVQEYFLHWVDPRCQRPCVTSGSAGRWPRLWVLISSSVSCRGKETVQTPPPGLRCRPWVRYGFAAGHASRTLRVYLYRGQHQHRIAPGLGVGTTLAGEAENLLSHSAGTAICGGSAIAAIAPITNASQEEIAVSLGTVFVLNSIALLTFPVIGTALHMTQSQFGLWAALAIHDISSVVGATAKYGAVALTVGTTVKLARALWIVPLSIGTALANKSKARIQWPWFILFFCLAAVANTYVHIFQSAYPVLKHLGAIGLTVTLYLIGTGLSMKTLREVGVRPFLQGILLWLFVAVGSLSLIRTGWIHL